MLTLRPFDAEFPIESQLSETASPVTLVNVITLGGMDEEAFLSLWRDDAAFMKRQPGFISTQLRRAVGKSPTYVNQAVWESVAAFRDAFTHPEFQGKLAAYPPCVTAAPYLFEKVAVSGVCVK